MKFLSDLRAFLARQSGSPVHQPDESSSHQAGPEVLQAEVARLTPTFEQMRDGGFDTSTPLLWGYFFLNPTKPPLLHLQHLLEARGFQTAGFERVDKGAFQLHVETVEVHSPRTLGARNLEFHALAKTHAVALYDGWDVGRPSTPVH